ncbi:hypothetical protein [Kibdelosporangium philippinense]|uniref:hypothetical protein n=1 Tax=Kibdelosporangium philippinense TaxID=211113 RepID=UPI003619D092
MNDRALIKFAAEVVAQPRVSDALFAEVRGFLSDREVVRRFRFAAVTGLSAALPPCSTCP